MVAECKSNDKEGDSQEHSDSGNDVDEMVDLLGNRRLSCVQTRGQTGDTAHHGVVTTADNHSLGRT